MEKHQPCQPQPLAVEAVDPPTDYNLNHGLNKKSIVWQTDFMKQKYTCIHG